LIETIGQFLDSGSASCAVLGTNGSGKSQLAEELFQRAAIPCALVSLEQQIAVLDEERRNDDSDFMDCQDPGRSALCFIKEGGAITPELEQWFDAFRMRPMLDRGLKLLSTGEFRKVQVCRALAEKPKRMILDEPFDGLDAASQQELQRILSRLVKAGLQLVLLLNRVDEIADCVEQVFLIDEAGLVDTVAPGEELDRFFKMEALPDELPAPPERERLELPAGTPLVDFRKVRVAYGENVIFDGLDWVVEPGRHWRVSGPNGCGKTTLLEMVTGDHPQLFANEVSVFGIRRGSGESVWDIKKHIGHVSSSVQVNYRVLTSVLNTVISGFHDSIGIYRKPSPAELKCAREWLKILHLQHKADRPLRSLSYGEQRMVLIARAMVKLPMLLILDEPCQGLDEVNRRTILKLINHIGERSGTTVLYVSHHATDRIPCIKQQLEMGR
jgi:molybdate transport system ATP-binding protein